ncbi:MAG: M1 family aminopeptidase [bacterium]|nr:M1 family aminopeptidase [bacterium]
MMILIITLLYFNEPLFLEKESFLRGSISKQTVNAEFKLADSISGYDVINYDIRLEISFPGKQITKGWTEITAVATDNIDTAQFNFVGLNIDSVVVNGIGTNYTRTDSGLNKLLNVDLGTTIMTGDTFVIGIGYNGTPSEGLYYSTVNAGIAYTMSVIWPVPVGARYWFPCNDVFTDKATSSISITVPLGYDVVANGVLEKVDTISTNCKYKWVESYSIPTWYLAFSISKYVILRDTFSYKGDTMPVANFVFRSDSASAVTAFSNVTDMLTFFSDTFGDGYPFFNEKYGFVRLPDLKWAMEYPTNVFFALTIPNNHTREMTIAHETSHQWWGGSITPISTKDIWLNEGFATYSEALYSNHWQSGLSYKNYMKLQIMDTFLVQENSPLGHPFSIYAPSDNCLWTPTTYEKGASVLHMLRHITGDSLFFAILKNYYATYKYKTASTADFQNIVEGMYGKDLDWFFDEWIYKAGHPSYEYAFWYDSLAVDSFNLHILVKQVQSHNYNVPSFKMPIDIKVNNLTGDTVSLVIEDSLDSQKFNLLLNIKPVNISFDPDNWILKTKKLIGIEESVNPQSKIPNLQLAIYPNPFIQKTVISYSAVVNSTPNNSHKAELSIYDLTGRVVKSFLITNTPITINKITWDGRNNAGEKVGSGIYFCELKDGNQKKIKKINLIK